MNHYVYTYNLYNIVQHVYFNLEKKELQCMGL